MIFRPCTYHVLENEVIVKFDDFVESKKREILFYSGYDLSKSSMYVLMCKTIKEDGSENYIVLSEPGSKVDVAKGCSNEIHKAIVNNIEIIKNQVLKNFGYVWV